MLSHVLIDDLEKDVATIIKFRNRLIDDNVAINYSSELLALSSLLGKLEAIIQLSREGKI